MATTERHFLDGGGELGALICAQDIGRPAAGRDRSSAPGPAHRRAGAAQFQPSDVHLVGSGPHPVLQRRLPQDDGTRAPSRRARPAGARMLGRDLADHRAADRVGHGGRLRPGTKTNSYRSRAMASARTCGGRTATAPFPMTTDRHRRRPRRLHRCHERACGQRRTARAQRSTREGSPAPALRKRPPEVDVRTGAGLHVHPARSRSFFEFANATPTCG